MPTDARFYFTPPQSNGYWPKLTTNGRWLAYGNVQNWVVDLHHPAQAPTLIANEGQVLGFMSDDILYASQRDEQGVPTLYHYNLPNFKRQVAYVGPAAFGTEAHASLWNWATFPNGPGYVCNGAVYVPTQPLSDGSGLGQNGPWINYQTVQLVDGVPQALPVVENFVTRQHRVIMAPGVIAGRVFQGPDGLGYFFYRGSDGRPYINTPENITLYAGLPNCQYGEGFGALAWRDGVMWVCTYSSDTGVCLALLRPYGAADCVQLTGIAANDKTMQIGQGDEGWTVAGMGSFDNPGYLGCWVNVPYDAVRTPYGGSHDGTTPIPPTPIPPTPTPLPPNIVSAIVVSKPMLYTDGDLKLTVRVPAGQLPTPKRGDTIQIVKP